jgi:chorismate-pyruvate lyase
MLPEQWTGFSFLIHYRNAHIKVSVSREEIVLQQNEKEELICEVYEKQIVLKNMVKGFTYVIGHTMIKEMHMANNIIAIDCLGTSKEYLVIQNGEAFARKIVFKDEQ